jgi:hypothetical protein
MPDEDDAGFLLHSLVLAESQGSPEDGDGRAPEKIAAGERRIHDHLISRGI